MNSFFKVLPKRGFLMLTVSKMICLILLINLSFKIIAFPSLLFTANSILCPLVAIFYLLVLKECTIEQQRQVLNQSLLALYLFSIGIYLLINIPILESIQENSAYKIIYENLPKKFFAATLAFGLSFYLPHSICSVKNSEMLVSPKKQIILALSGGFFFFNINFILLFLDPHFFKLNPIYFNSLMISGVILLLVGVIYLCLHLMMGQPRTKQKKQNFPVYLTIPTYHYLVSFSVIILLISLASEYCLIRFSDDLILAASALFFPLILIVSNLVGELYGYKANLRLTLVLISAELTFELVLKGTTALPSPDFFNLNPFYSYIVPRRIPIGILATFLAFVSNVMLLENLKYTSLGLGRSLRILIANIFATSLFCFINYGLLYTGIYSQEQIYNLFFTSWMYKIIAMIFSLPFVLWLYRFCEKR